MNISSFFSSSSGNPFKVSTFPSSRFLSFVLLVVAVSVSGGCGLTGGSGSDSNDNNPAVNNNNAQPVAETTGESPAEVASGPCVNSYYPIEPGMKRKYAMTSSVKGGDTGLTLEQTAPEGDTFTEVRTLNSGTTVTTPWKCTEDGLRVAEYENFIDSKVGKFSMETLESSGITIPVSWKKGDEWDSTYKIKANIKAGPVTASADGTVKITNQLVAESEKVTVKGGEFDAARVDAVIGIEISMQGAKVPKQSIRLSRWYSPKVGLVKQEVYGSFGNEKMEYAGTP